MFFGLFKKKHDAARVEPTAPFIGSKLPSRLDCAVEAIESLGYLKPGAAQVIAEMIEDELVNHPRLTTTDYRKAGEQIGDDEKRSLGVRKNGFMSRQAMNDLTEKGRSKPLDAHEISLRRATFAYQRVRTIRQGWGHKIDEFKHSSFDMTCPACHALDGTITSGVQAHIYPPTECICEAGRFGLSIYIDFFEELVKDELKRRRY